MYGPLAAAVIAAVAAALVMALTLVPVLSGTAVTPADGKHEDVWLVRGVKSAYTPALDTVVHHS